MGHAVENLFLWDLEHGATLFIAGRWKKATNDNTVIICPKNFPAIDAVGFGRKVFQVTISKDHSLNPEGMKDILIAAGILTIEGELNKTTIEGEQNETTIEEEKEKKRISFYWVVPAGIVEDWKGHVQKKCKGDGYILQKAVKEYVQQFVLKLPDDNVLDGKMDVDKMFGLRKRQEDK